MTKEEAAVELGMSVRALERQIAKGAIHPVKEKKPGGGFILRFDREELDRYRAEMEKPKAVPIVTVPTSTQTQARNQALARAVPEILQAQGEQIGAQGAKLDAIVDALQAIAAGLTQMATPPAPPTLPEKAGGMTERRKAVPIEARMILSAEDASALAGVPLARIRGAIKAGELRAVKVGRGARVLREDVEQWARSLFNEPTPKKRKTR